MKHEFSVRALVLVVSVSIAPAALSVTTEEKIELLTQEIEQMKQELRQRQAPANAAAPDSAGGQAHGASPSHTRISHGGATAGTTAVGGYGELHYNNLDSEKEIDFHRFILFLGHKFSDRVRFFSELELEHSVAGDGQNGEIELEQAYIEFDLADQQRAVGGLFVIPVGILNEVHEPPTFYGVERNPVETDIIPTTWWEGGAGVNGELAPGWGYDFVLTSGLNVPTTGGSAFRIRNGRQKVSESRADDLAYTGRIKWTGMPGLELAATLQYQQDVAQSTLSETIGATLAETHVAYNSGPFGLRALYARWELDGDAPKAVGRDKQEGWYVEPSYKILPAVGVFARYNEWNNEAGSGGAEDNKQTNIGVNYWPHENVVLKFDWQNQSGRIDDDGFNLAVGYMF